MEFIKNNLLIIGVVVVVLYLVFFTELIFKKKPNVNQARLNSQAMIRRRQAQLNAQRQGVDSTSFRFGRHNIPHPDNQDGAIYRADGQVQIASDDLIRLRHIRSKQTGVQFDVRPGAGDVKSPNGMMKITRQGIMFGGPNNNKEVNSAQISAGLHIPNSLNIVGMSANKNAGARKVDVWAEGGMGVFSNHGIKVRGHGRETSYGSLNGGWSHFSTTAPQFYMNKSLQVNGGVSSYHNRPLNMPHGGNVNNTLTIGPSGWNRSLVLGGKNRESVNGAQAHIFSTNGNLHLDSQNGHDIYLNHYTKRPVRVQGTLCIGNTCINENHLQSLIGRRAVTLRSAVNGRRLQNAQNENQNARFTNANRGSWETIFIEPL